MSTADRPALPGRESRALRPVVGPLLIAVCVLHCALAVVDGADIWAQAVRDGWVGAFDGTEEQAVLWFLATGLVGIVAGISITVIERVRSLPWVVTVPLLFVAVFGVIAAPTSGFWLVLAVAIVAVVRSAGQGPRLRQP